MKLRSSIVPSVGAIGRPDWDRLFGDIPEGREFYATLENSRLEGFDFCYVLVDAEGRLELIAPLFWTDLDLGIGVEGLAQAGIRAVRKLFPRFLVVRTLFCGSPFGENGTIGIGAEGADRPALLAELLRAMERICREKSLALMMFKDFPETALPFLDPLRFRGFLKGASFPNVELSLPGRTIDDYLAGLSPGARKDLRRKIRRTLSAGPIEARVVDEVGPWIEDVYRLYLNTYHAGTVRFEKLTKEYFVEAGARMRGQARFFLFFAEGRLVCFNLCFLHGGCLIDKFIGMDYSTARERNLYFYTWFHNVRWCYENGVRRYQVGQTDTGAKVHLGGGLVPLFFFARHLNPILNLPLRIAGRFLAPRT